jgi:hypothetical protein
MMVYANPQVGGGAVEHIFSQKNDAGGAPYSQTFISANADATNTYSSGSIAFGGYSGSNAGITATIDGNWHNFTGVRNSANYAIYTDGVLIDNAPQSNQDLTMSPARYLALGSRGNGTTESYRNSIAFAFAWNRTLSADEVAAVNDDPFLLFIARSLPRIYFAPAAAVSSLPKISTIVRQAAKRASTF